MRFIDYAGPPFEGDPTEAIKQHLACRAKHGLADAVKELGTLQRWRSFYLMPIVSADGHMFTYRGSSAESRRVLEAYYDKFAIYGLSEFLPAPHDPWKSETISDMIEGGIVIDLGANDGVFTVYYALNHPDKYFLGIDLSGESLKQAVNRAEKKGIKNAIFLRGNAFDFAFDDADTVIASNLMHEFFGSNFEFPEASFLEILGKEDKPPVRLGGKIIFSNQYNKTWPDLNSRRVQDVKVHGFELEDYRKTECKEDDCFVASFRRVA